MNACSTTDCVSPTFRRGMCQKHYRLALRDGAFPPSPTMEERFWAKVEKTDSCWLWTASCDSHGYGGFAVRRRTQLAHRVAYQLAVGPIPDGLTLDHLCFVTTCVNPEHLEPVTMAENIRRRRTHSGRGRTNGTTCRNGLHPWPESALWFPSEGARRCGECRRERARSSRALADTG